MWQSQAPSRAAFFAWLVALGNILTLDNLKKQHVIVMGHLLFHCDETSAILSALFSRFVLSWVMHKCVVDLYACWWSFDRSKSVAV